FVDLAEIGFFSLGNDPVSRERAAIGDRIADLDLGIACADVVLRLRNGTLPRQSGCGEYDREFPLHRTSPILPNPLAGVCYLWVAFKRQPHEKMAILLTFAAGQP